MRTNPKNMEVLVPTSPEFNFSISRAPNSPYPTAPSSPIPFGNSDEFYYHCYTSAPTSPARAAAVYSYMSSEMNYWEEKPLTPKPRGREFDFGSGQGGREKLSAAAAELFEEGQIGPLNLKPQGELPPRHSGGSWSPRPRGGLQGEEKWKSPFTTAERKGREISMSSPVPSSTNRRESRSLSPIRGGEASTTATPPATKSSTGSKKWPRLKDLLLFRSASEGRATGRGRKDPLHKYTLLSMSFNKNKQRGDQDTQRSKYLDNISSFKRGNGHAMSPHELHYTANRAASEEQKKKTPLPYHRNTLFGCLHFNPAVRSLARGFNSSSFNRSN